MNTITILIGGNIGNTQQYINDAEKLLIDQIGPIHKSSSLFESEPWGFDSEQWFLNKVIQVVDCELLATQVLEVCQSIEKKLGRTQKKTSGYESRPIDIDILFFNDEIINLPQLIVPHPKLHLRRFTLLPLQEVMNDYIHPVLCKSINELVKECDDMGVCRILILFS